MITSHLRWTTLTLLIALCSVYSLVIFVWLGLFGFGGFYCCYWFTWTRKWSRVGILGLFPFLTHCLSPVFRSVLGSQNGSRQKSGTFCNKWRKGWRQQIHMTALLILAGLVRKLEFDWSVFVKGCNWVYSQEEVLIFPQEWQKYSYMDICVTWFLLALDLGHYCLKWLPLTSADKVTETICFCMWRSLSCKRSGFSKAALSFDLALVSLRFS